MKSLKQRLPDWAIKEVREWLTEKVILLEKPEHQKWKTVKGKSLATIVKWYVEMVLLEELEQ